MNNIQIQIPNGVRSLLIKKGECKINNSRDHDVNSISSEKIFLKSKLIMVVKTILFLLILAAHVYFKIVTQLFPQGQFTGCKACSELPVRVSACHQAVVWIVVWVHLFG